MGYPDIVMDIQKPRYFKTPDAFRKWLERHHASKGELLVGYYKVGSGRPSMACVAASTTSATSFASPRADPAANGATSI